jgi:pimeloyl-ACP methyl ester carboxylesterase
VLSGDSDPIVPPAQSHLIAEKVPRADLVVLKGAGHFPSVESPAEYQQAVSEWLHRQLN